jgi:hypothetical protein
MGQLVLGNHLHPNAADVEDDSTMKQLIVESESQYSRQKRSHKIWLNKFWEITTIQMALLRGVTPHKSASSPKNVESRPSQTICCFSTIIQHKNTL